MPWSRKYSAMAVATHAPLKRTRAGWSDVDTTTTERASPSAPRSRSMNSRTSRPRSPIRAITLTSARRVAGDHAQQRALAHAAAGEDADALALAAGQQAVDRPHAGTQRLADGNPSSGCGACGASG